MKVFVQGLLSSGKFEVVTMSYNKKNYLNLIRTLSRNGKNMNNFKNLGAIT